MKKRTRAAQKRLNNLLLILLLTAVLLIMSTYAWFTANKTVNIDSIDLKVATSSGLQISADGKNWKTILEFKDIKNAYDVNKISALNQLPYLMAPVSSALEVDGDGHLKMFYGDMETDLTQNLPNGDPNPHYGEATVSAVLAATAKGTAEVESYGTGLIVDNNGKAELGTDVGEYDAGYYMAFDIWLKDTVESNTLYMTGSVTEDDTKEYGAANAMRVALVKGGTYANVENPEDENTIKAIQQLDTKGGKVYLWEPNNEKHTTKATEHAADLYAHFANARWQIPASGPLAYDAFKAPTTTPLAVSTALASQYGTLLTTVTDGMNSNNVKFESTASTDTLNYDLEGLDKGATRYRVYIWMEGQDVDCQNDASGSEMQFNLSFSLNSFEGTTTSETPDVTP